MPEIDANALQYRPIAIPWWVGMVRWAVTVPYGMLLHYGKPEWAALPGKAYKNWDLRDAALVDRYGEWLFAGLVSGTAMEFRWNPPISDAERAVPISDYETNEQYTWHPILEDLQFVTLAAQAGVVVPREAYRDGITCPCLVRLREYVSNTPFTAARIQLEIPIPGRISWDLGQGGSFPECLHPDVVVDARGNGDNVVYDATPTVRGPRLTAKRTYRHTNFTTWETHNYVASVTWDDELYHLNLKTVSPPELSSLIK